MVQFADAKINLGLNVLERLDSGYHTIDTVMYHVGWRDILEVVPASKSGTTLTTSGRAVDCLPEKNLVMKAYHAMSELYRLPESDLYLHKTIPDGAGLGGGSSDAANMLKILRDMYCTNVTDDQLAGIAARLGADCPFFIYDKPMHATGIGTDLSPIAIDLRGYVIALVKIDKSVSTREAYAGVTPRYPTMRAGEIVTNIPIEEWHKYLTNDFEQSVFAIIPELALIKDELYKMGSIYASMSGSGSTIYGLFPASTIITDLRADLSNKFHNSAIFVDVLR